MPITAQQIPKNILEYFGSESIQAIIGEINEQAEIYTPSFVPALIYDLVSKNIPAHDFINELAKTLDISPKRATSITKEIKEKVLEPERKVLFLWGVNISDINVLNAAPIEKLFPEDQTGPQPEKAISLDNLDVGKQTQEQAQIKLSEMPKSEISIKKEIPIAAIEPPKEGEPLIIHREESFAQEAKPGFRGFSLVGLFRSKRKEPETESTTKAKVEIPDETVRDLLNKLPIKKEEQKVVHYSEFRTPLTPFQDGDEFINLEKTNRPETQAEAAIKPTESAATLPEITRPTTTEGEKTTSGSSGKNFLWFDKKQKENTIKKIETAPKKPAIKTEPVSQKTQNQPKLEGNVVDLR